MYENYRKDDIENHLNKIGFTPLDVMVTGATGAGKSSTLNSFFDKTVAKSEMVLILKLWNWILIA